MLISDLPAANAIKVGRFYVKPPQFDETITRTCRRVFLEADVPGLQLGRSGTSTLLRFGGKNFVVATRHQLGIRSGERPSKAIVESVRIARGGSLLSNIPIGRCVYEIDQPNEESHDLLAFKVGDNWAGMAEDLPYFFPVEPLSEEDRRASFYVGNPTLDIVMGPYTETFGTEAQAPINIRRSIGSCQLDTTFRTHSRHFLRYLNTSSRTEMDGYSGGAVFSLVGEVGYHRTVLDGIIVRGGVEFIYVVDADYLVTMLSETANR